MLGRTKKQLIYYSQYLDIHTMQVKSDADLMLRSQRESQLFNTLRGVTETPELNTVKPQIIQFLANEINLLGQYFVKQAFETYAMVDD
jgi:hypothetical protein